MKKYLIRIKCASGCCLFTTIYGDTPSRPFTIDGNLWSYAAPGWAAHKLESLAQSWEAHGHKVCRIYGTIQEMPTKGDLYNVGITLREWGGGPD